MGSKPGVPPITTVHTHIQVDQPNLRPWLVTFIRPLAGPYRRLALGCNQVQVSDYPLLVQLWSQALRGEIRLIVAFRHPYGDEPQLLSWVFWRGIPSQARNLGISLVKRSHGLFVHGYEVPRWGGAFLRWLLPRMGAMPVHHTKLDRTSLNRIILAIEQGEYPLALAPEGQVSYSAFNLPRIEPGAVRLGLEAQKRLGNHTPVVILPLSITRTYPYKSGYKSYLRLVKAIEHGSGIQVPRVIEHPMDRLVFVAKGLVYQARLYYGLEVINEPVNHGDQDPWDRQLNSDFYQVVCSAVVTAERILGIKHHHRGLNPNPVSDNSNRSTNQPAHGIRNPKDGIIDRVYRIRQVAWDRIYPELEQSTNQSVQPGESDQSKAPQTQKVLTEMAHRRAGEAWYAMRHMELADFGWYFDPMPLWFIEEKGTGKIHQWNDPRVVEYTQNLWDLINRLSGGAISGRKQVMPYNTQIALGNPLDLSQHLEKYDRDKKSTVDHCLKNLAQELST
jgi:hypothetical protein